MMHHLPRRRDWLPALLLVVLVAACGSGNEHATGPTPSPTGLRRDFSAPLEEEHAYLKEVTARPFGPYGKDTEPASWLELGYEGCRDFDRGKGFATQVEDLEPRGITRDQVVDFLRSVTNHLCPEHRDIVP